MDTISESRFGAAREALRESPPGLWHPSARGAASPGARSAGGDFLALRLDGAEYAVAVVQVQELRSWEPPTRLRGAAPCILGVVNLRGCIVPIVDLRLRLGGAAAEIGARHVVVVLLVRGRRIGIVVDAVSEVVEIDALQIAAASGDGRGGSCVSGVARIERDGIERPLLLLDGERLLHGTGL